MKVLLIGSGSIGSRHINNVLNCIPKTSVYVLRADGREDKFTQDLSALVITSWNDIPSDIELVILANPSAKHAVHIEKIIENNLPAYLEKPLVTSRNDLEWIKKIIQACQYKAPTMMGCNLRFLPSILRIKEILNKGLLGNICRAYFEAGQYLPQWRPNQDYTQRYSANADLGGGVIFDLAHELDLVRFLIGECEVISSRYDHLSHLKINAEDTAVIHLASSQGSFISSTFGLCFKIAHKKYKNCGR